MLAALMAYVFSSPQLGIYNIKGGFAGLWRVGRRLRRLGYPLALAAGVEALAFATMTIFAGLLGTEQLAVFQVVITSIAFIFMAAVGVGAATAVRVGFAVGRQDVRETKWAGWTGLGVVTAIMVLASIVILAAPESVIRIYSNDPAIVALGPGVLLVGGLLLVFDGGQGVLMGALRGTGDVWIPGAIQLMSFWMVMVPVGTLFAFVFDWGAQGLMGAVMAGVFAAFLALGTRFLIVSGRAIRRL
jgi:MATE family multidrug resistance protein